MSIRLASATLVAGLLATLAPTDAQAQFSRSWSYSSQNSSSSSYGVTVGPSGVRGWANTSQQGSYRSSRSFSGMTPGGFVQSTHNRSGGYSNNAGGSFNFGPGGGHIGTYQNSSNWSNRNGRTRVFGPGGMSQFGYNNSRIRRSGGGNLIRW